MHFLARTIITGTAVAGLTASAVAAELTGPEIKALLSGKTVYLEATAASSSGQAGQGVIYWAEDGTALYKTPSGAVMHGKWEIKANSNCVEWKERPYGMRPVRQDRRCHHGRRRSNRPGPRQNHEYGAWQCRKVGAVTNRNC